MKPVKSNNQDMDTWTTTKMKDNKGNSSNYERQQSIKPEVEKVETYSFPGQYVTSNAFANKVSQDFAGSYKNSASEKRRPQKKIVFDPTTQKVNFA